jgi:hypothetical protein
MANGQQPTALEQAAYVPNVKPDFREQFVQGAAATAPRGTDLDALEQQMAQHHQQRLDEARMHKQNLAQAGALLHYGINPATNKPLTPEERQRYMNEYNAAKQAYMKVAGVNKQTKEALNKSFMIMDHMIGPGAQNQQGPPQPGGFTPSPQAQQAAPGASPQEQAIAAEGAGATAAQPSAAPGGGGPPPVPFEDEAPFLMEQLGEHRQLEWERKSGEQKEELSKKALADKIEVEAEAEKKYHINTYKQKVDDAEEALGRKLTEDEKFQIAGLIQKPKIITKIEPDDNSPTGYAYVSYDQLTNHEYARQANALPPRGFVPTETTSTRQQITIGPDGRPQLNTLRGTSTRKPVLGKGAAPTGGGGSPAPKTSGGKVGPAAQYQDVPRDAAGKPLGMPSGTFNVLNKSATPIDEARSSLIGNNPEQQVGGLAGDLDIYRDPASGERIKNYLSLVDNLTANEGNEMVKQGPTAAAEWYFNLPQTVIGLQTGALMDQYQKLNPKEQQFVADYFRVLGTVGGMRASTGASAQRWSYNVLRSEVPVPGIATYTDAKRRIGNFVEETNVVSKRNPLLKPVDRGLLDKAGGPPAPSNTVHFVEGGEDYDIPKDKVAAFQKKHPNAKRQ